MSLFLRLLGEEDKGTALLEAVRAVAAGEADPRVFDVEPASFEQVPGAPFAYWVRDGIRRMFRLHPVAESDVRRFTKGLCTTDDFRFLRLYWENRGEKQAVRWFHFVNGGSTTRFYQAVNVAINWYKDGLELKAFLDGKIGKENQWSRWINSVTYYFRPGITWPLRTARFSPQVLPAGTIFSVRSYAAFMPKDALLCALGLMRSSALDFLLKLSLGRSGHPEFVIGVIQQAPFPQLASSECAILADTARTAWSLKRKLDTATLTSHAFLLPALLQVQGKSLDTRCGSWSDRMQQTEQALAEIQSEIDASTFMDSTRPIGRA